MAHNVVAAVVAREAAGSGALMAFGLGFSGGGGGGMAVRPERREPATLKAIGVSFFALAAYVVADAVGRWCGGARRGARPSG